MFIQPIGINTNNGIINKKFQRKDTNFTGYGETLAGAARKEFTTKVQVADVIERLFKDIVEVSGIERTADFNSIEAIYRDKGFIGLLKELRNPKDVRITDVINKSKRGEPYSLASYMGDWLGIYNNGRHISFKNLFNLKNAPRDFELQFNHRLEGLSIGLDRQGRLRLTQTINSSDVAETTFGKMTIRRNLQSPVPNGKIYDQNGNLDEMATDLYNKEGTLILKNTQNIDTPLF